MPVSSTVSVPLTTLSSSGSLDPEMPYVLSYFAQRRAAGYIGLALPVVTVLLNPQHVLAQSISAYYYLGMRNVFVGSLCAVGVFLISALGYQDDRKFSWFAGAMAFLVAFFPCKPPNPKLQPHFHSNIVHGIAATLLFLTFAYFCLVLFCRTAANPTAQRPQLPALSTQKGKRNLVFIVCGSAMLAAMAGLLIALAIDHELNHHQVLITEWICLWSFGIAWLVKGQRILADITPGSD